MIIGIGSDLVDMRRIRRVIERFGDRFLNRVYTGAEVSLAESRKTRVETYAKRFAAKEACAKALGTGLRRGVYLRDMGVVNLKGGRPTMVLTGGALRRLDSLVPEGWTPRIDLSLSDEPPLAQAFVVISCLPDSGPSGREG